jgi:hypothetical protein
MRGLCCFTSTGFRLCRTDGRWESRSCRRERPGAPAFLKTREFSKQLSDLFSPFLRAPFEPRAPFLFHSFLKFPGCAGVCVVMPILGASRTAARAAFAGLKRHLEGPRNLLRLESDPILCFEQLTANSIRPLLRLDSEGWGLEAGGWNPSLQTHRAPAGTDDSTHLECSEL